ncbi:MAG: DUF4377 domain-containing protein [Prevotellaceae bacterium]|jgi:hypothetical protein|nr:DUF4377 domain-containing protein [Prevotellaceae bacterium]
MKQLLYYLVIAFVVSSCGSNTNRITVASHKADCVGVAPQKCLLIKTGASTDREYVYSEIEGFDYEEGYEYELDIKEVEVKDPPADASSVRYVLANEISKTPKTSEGLPFEIVTKQLYQWGGRVLEVTNEDVGMGAAAGKMSVVVVKLHVTHATADIMKPGDIIYCELVPSPRVMPVEGREYVFKARSAYPAHAKGVYFLETDVMDLVV